MSHGMVGTVSTLIVDDEQLARDELAFLLKEFPEIEEGTKAPRVGKPKGLPGTEMTASRASGSAL